MAFLKIPMSLQDFRNPSYTVFRILYFCPKSKNKYIIADCAESYPLLDNGFISERTYDPISATYSCNSGFTSIGSGNTITCRPGGKWSTLSYVCRDHGKIFHLYKYIKRCNR